MEADEGTDEEEDPQRKSEAYRWKLAVARQGSDESAAEAAAQANVAAAKADFEAKKPSSKKFPQTEGRRILVVTRYNMMLKAAMRPKAALPSDAAAGAARQ